MVGPRHRKTRMTEIVMGSRVAGLSTIVTPWEARPAQQKSRKRRFFLLTEILYCFTLGMLTKGF